MMQDKKSESLRVAQFPLIIVHRTSANR